jgi:hypothetical protein
MTYAPTHEKDLFDRSHRRRMEMSGASRFSPWEAGPPEDPQSTQDPKCRLL